MNTQSLIGAEAKAKEAAEVQMAAQTKVDAEAKAAAAAKLKADMAEAQANAKTKATASKPQKPRKGKEATPMNADKLRELIAVVEAGNVPTQRSDLIHRLEVEELANLDDEDGTFILTLAGITRTGPSHAKVLELWCSAARRACMNAEAV